jgi:hypothetical protein
MSITDNFKNLFCKQSRISIVIALLSILTIGMTIQPPHQSVAQSVPLKLDGILENVLASSDLGVDILNDAQISSSSIQVIESLSSLLGDYNNNSVCFIDKGVRG